MSGRGVLFAVEDEELARLGDATNDAEIRAIVEEIERAWENACELEKAWDPIHRALTGGRLELTPTTPLTGEHAILAHAILGGALLLQTDDAIVTAKSHADVSAVAERIARWDRPTFRAAYYKIDRRDYGDLDEEDFAYAWSYFERLKAHFAEAARLDRGVVFSADL